MEISIKAPREGISASPLVGFGDRPWLKGNTHTNVVYADEQNEKN